MQLGMIGLGRMGANLVRRLMRDGHECVVYDVNADAVTAARERGRDRRAPRSRTSSPSSARPARAWIMVPGRVRRRRPSSELAALLERGDIIIDGGNSYYRDDIDRAARAAPRGHPLRRRRHQRRRVRPRARLLPDDRRRGRGRAAPRPDLPHHRARASTPRRARPGRTRRPGARRARLPALRPDRRRPLREDGPQRHRVRDHGRVRRGPQRSCSNADVGTQQAGARRRDHAAARPAVLPVRPRHPRGRRGLAARQRGRVVAARPHRARAARGPDLDDFEGRVSDSGEGRWTDRSPPSTRASRPRADRRALRALQLARRGRLRRQAPLGDAQGVRRPRREGERRSRGTSRGRRARVLRHARGDLAHKKIFPALYAMAKHGHARRPRDRRRVVATGRSTTCRTARATASSEYGGGVDDEAAFDRLIGARCATSTATTRDAATFTQLAAGARRRRRARRTTSRSRRACSRPVVEGLGTSGCADERAG